MPPILHVMKDIGGVEVPEYLAKLTGDGPATTASAPPAPPAVTPAEATAAKETTPPARDRKPAEKPKA
jgi:hypothetical protein